MTEALAPQHEAVKHANEPDLRPEAGRNGCFPDFRPQPAASYPSSGMA